MEYRSFVKIDFFLYKKKGGFIFNQNEDKFKWSFQREHLRYKSSSKHQRHGSHLNSTPAYVHKLLICQSLMMRKVCEKKLVYRKKKTLEFI